MMFMAFSLEAFMVDFNSRFVDNLGSKPENQRSWVNQTGGSFLQDTAARLEEREEENRRLQATLCERDTEKAGEPLVLSC